MKNWILAAALSCLPAQAFAISECAGMASDGSYVKVSIETSGVRGIAERGEVTIERQGNRFGYRFGKDEIAQFFEYDDSGDYSMVGLSAQAGGENPVTIRYTGPNFVDQDLHVVSQKGAANNLQGNVLRVWKGPGYAATEQYQVTKPACSVWSSI